MRSEDAVVTYYPRVDWAVGIVMARRGITHAALARDLGMSDRSLREKRLGRREFKASELVSLSHASGVPLSVLLAGGCRDSTDGGALALPRGRYYTKLNERKHDGKR